MSLPVAAPIYLPPLMATPAKPFGLIFSQIHRMWAIEKDCTHEEHWYLRQALQANRYDDPFYLAKDLAAPFFQGGSDNKQGFALIEFWVHCDESGKRLAQEYVDFLNEITRRLLSRPKNTGPSSGTWKDNLSSPLLGKPKAPNWIEMINETPNKVSKRFTMESSFWQARLNHDRVCRDGFIACGNEAPKQPDPEGGLSFVKVFRFSGPVFFPFIKDKGHTTVKFEDCDCFKKHK